MYTHIGDNVIVNSSDIVGIFDIEFYNEDITATHKNKYSNDMRTFVICSEKCSDNDKLYVYFTKVSTATLKKRTRKF